MEQKTKDKGVNFGGGTNFLIRHMQDRIANNLMFSGIEEIKKEQIVEAIKELEKENLNPVVEYAEVRCSEMEAKGPVLARSNALVVDVRNGASGLTIDDIVLEPGSFGYCKAMKKECKPEFLTDRWEKGDTKNLVNGRPALTMGSYLICVAGKGTITPYTDGQVVAKAEGYFEMELRKKGFPEGYIVHLMKLHEKYPNWEFEPVFTRVDYMDFINQQIQDKNKCAETEEYSTTNDYAGETHPRYKDATQDAIIYFSHPYSMLQTNDKFEYSMQFLEAKQVLPKEYVDKAVDYILRNKDPQIVEAIKNSNEDINPVFMASIYLLENGPVGEEYNGQLVYNLFNVGATSGRQSGKEYAYNQGWFTLEDCIEGSGELFQKYLDRGQSTLYAMDWNYQAYGNTGGITGQYATLVNDAANKAKGLSQFEENIDLNHEFVFSIPIYDNLPTYNNEPHTAFPDPKEMEN